MVDRGVGSASDRFEVYNEIEVQIEVGVEGRVDAVVECDDNEDDVLVVEFGPLRAFVTMMMNVIETLILPLADRRIVLEVPLRAVLSIKDVSDNVRIPQAHVEDSYLDLYVSTAQRRLQVVRRIPSGVFVVAVARARVDVDIGSAVGDAALEGGVGVDDGVNHGSRMQYTCWLSRSRYSLDLLGLRRRVEVGRHDLDHRMSSSFSISLYNRIIATTHIQSLPRSHSYGDCLGVLLLYQQNLSFFGTSQGRSGRLPSSRRCVRRGTKGMT
jgi:hypothetical protein